MLHPHTELRLVNDDIGYGVFVTRRIPKGTVTWARDELDQSFDPFEMERFSPEYRAILEKYTFVDSNGLAVLCWDLARFVNHSCEANCLGAGYDFEIAIRDIHPGEELTDDYGTLNLRENFPCRCGRKTCRQLVQPDDLMRYWEQWDAALRTSFPQIPRVEQPLKWFVKNYAEIEDAAGNPDKIRSCRYNYSPRICESFERQQSSAKSS